MVTENTQKSDESFCRSCGEIIKSLAEVCPKCGVRQRESSDESSTPMLLNILIGFLGILGIGHIVKRRTSTGLILVGSSIILWILFWTTIGFVVGLIFIPIYIGLWIWSIIDVRKLS